MARPIKQIKRIAHTKHTEQNNSASTLVRAIGVPVLTLVGALIIFCSWIFQNHFKAKSADEILYLEKTQYIISIEENRMNQLLIQLNLEWERTPRNNGLLATAALKTIQASSNLLAWAESRVTDPPGSGIPILAKNLYQEKAVNNFKTGHVEELITMAKEVTELSNKFTAQLTNSYADRLSTARQHGDSWNLIFLVSYIIGSAILALAWALANILGWPTTMKPNPSVEPTNSEKRAAAAHLER